MEQQGYRNINGMFPYTSYLIPGMLLYGVHDHPRLMSAQQGYAYVLDHRFIMNQHNINSIPTQTRDTDAATRRRYNTNVDRNQPRVNVSSAYAHHVQDGHFILDENIDQVNRQVPTRRRDTGATRRQHNTNVDRNQPRMNTQDGSSSAVYAYVQDGHFIFHENIGQVNRQVSTRRRDIGGATQRRFDANLERIIIQEVSMDSEDMTCSICLVKLPIGSKAIRLPSPCLHVYHEDCILKWFDKSSTCPLCRRTVL